jgi:transposase
MWDKAQPLRLNPSQVGVLERFLADAGTPRHRVVRARVLLGASEGRSNNELAKESGVSRATVLRWRQKCANEGVDSALQRRRHPGRPQSLDPKKELEIVQTTLDTMPAKGIRWTVRGLAQAKQVSPTTVFRIWRKHGLLPSRSGAS